MPLPFRDRREAGKFLAGKLRAYQDRADVLVLALPRGGVPVAFEAAQGLHAPLDVFVVRKLGVPGHEELAFGAIAPGSVLILNQLLVRQLGISQQMINAVVAREKEELARRERIYRGARPPPEVRGQTVILIDDGLATGATMLAAAKALWKERPEETVVAVPVAARETCHDLESEVDRVVCAVTPEPFYAVSRWYEDFSETTDEEVRELLDRTARQKVS